MAYIKTIHERDATGDLATWYARVGNPDGTVDNVMKVHSLNLDSLRTHFELYTAAMHGQSPLSRAEREMVAVAVSRLNGCRYCLRHHHAGLTRLLPDDRHAVADALADGSVDGLTDREHAMVTYAAQLTLTPASARGGKATAAAAIRIIMLAPVSCCCGRAPLTRRLAETSFLRLMLVRWWGVAPVSECFRPDDRSWGAGSSCRCRR